MSTNKRNTDIQATASVLETTPSVLAVPGLLDHLISKVLGLILWILGVTLFIQVTPLLFVFLGSWMGLAAATPLNRMDSGVWLLTSVVIAIPWLLGLLYSMRWVGRTFIFRTLVIFKRRSILKSAE